MHIRILALSLFCLLSTAPAFAQPFSPPCHEIGGKKRLRQVLSVEADGTLVLDGNERIFLAGVELPEDKASSATSVSCLEESVNYIRARIGQRPIFVIPAAMGRDTKYRAPSYVTESEGGLLNLELIRYGFATASKVLPGTTKPLSCAQEFSDAEKGARQKKISGWKSGCLKSDHPEEPDETKDEPEIDLGGEVIDF
ncbi:MAG: thermonuclease family protein [Bdellovibrionales bacterium]|nr:thermonuclease family protein [Bdellovibrionales bacterium]